MAVMADAHRDVAIVGAGLSGLIAGLYAQKAGHRVTIIERRRAAGGLCGTFEMDGHEFVIACNDFGSGMVELLRELEIDFPFERKKTIVFQSGRRIVLPLGLGTLPALLADGWHWLRLLFAVLRRPRGAAPETLAGFVDRVLPPSRAADLAKLPAYLMGVTPDNLSTEVFGYEKRYGYGYTAPACPVGGPGVFVRTLCELFARRGGDLWLDTEVSSVSGSGRSFVVQTSRGECPARSVISTVERESAYPKDQKRGLPLSMLCVALDSRFEWPRHVHTIVHYPPNVSRWFAELDRGEQPEEYGFHLFASDLPRTASEYTVNVYFYLPRGKSCSDAAEVSRITGYLLPRIEAMLPGFTSHVLYSKIVDAEAFTARHGLSSRVMPFVLPPGAERPRSYDPRTGVFHAGHTVFPPGEHAGAAALSGKLTAEEVTRALGAAFWTRKYRTRELVDELSQIR